MKIHSLTKISIFVALGIVLQVIDAMIAFPINIPGGKIGLANIVSICALIAFPASVSFAIAAIRAVLGGLIFGGVMASAYSLIGAVFSMTIMILIKPSRKISYIGIGILGAVMHNVGQVCLAAVILKSGAPFAYLPSLLILSAFSGAAVGFAGERFSRYEKNHFGVGLTSEK